MQCTYIHAVLYTSTDTSIENQPKLQRNVRLQVVGILPFTVPVLVVGEVEGDHGVDHVRQQLLLLCRVQLHVHLRTLSPRTCKVQ